MSKLFQTCRCGNCAECQQNIKNEWMYRTYYEAKDTFEKGGYVVFDTLTYSEDNVPWSKNIIKRDYGIDISESLNFRCFDYTDVQKFFKRLRKQIKYYCGSYGVLKYKLVCEYGTKDGKTHRPHYHILFFIKDGKINPQFFSHIVRKSWTYGITDGVDDKGLSYFLKNRLFKDSKQGVINSVGYINKYVSKDSQYQKIVRQKVSEIEKLFDKFDENYKNTYQGKLRKLSLRRSLNQFSRNSEGYGIKALDEIDNELLWNEGKVVMPDSYKIKRKIIIPMYYYRKKFQKFDKELKQWNYTYDGLRYKIKRTNKCVDILTNVYENRLKNVLTIGQNIEDKRIKLLLSEKSYADIVKNIISLLDGRSLRDYAKFKIYYQHRLINENDTIYHENDVISNNYNHSDCFYKMFVSLDKSELVGNEKFVEYIDSFCCPGYIDINRLTNFEYFVNCRMINSDNYYPFRDYDKIDNEMRKLALNENLKKQITYDYLCNQRKKFKKFDL